MSTQTTRRIKSFIAAVFAVALAALAPFAVAYDTDIYFSAAESGTPNVLLLLDTSGSMAYDTLGSPGVSRADTLKQVLQSLLNRLDNVNMGMMRMNVAGTGALSSPQPSGFGIVTDAFDSCGVAQQAEGGENPTFQQLGGLNACYVPGGGSVLYPVTNLDTPVNALEAETIFNRVSDSADDAVQVGSTVDTTARTLSLATQQCESGGALAYAILADNDDAWEGTSGSPLPNRARLDLGSGSVGVRFSDVNIPRGATVSAAYLEFFIVIAETKRLSMEIHGDTSNNYAPRTYSSANNIAGRSQTTNSVLWDGVDEVVAADVVLRTPDLTAIIQEIISHSDWLVGAPGGPATQPVSFILSDGIDALDAALLGAAAPSVISEANSGRSAAARDIDPTLSPLLKVTWCLPYGSPQRAAVGVRFQDVYLPQGVTIDHAFLDFANLSFDPAFHVGTSSLESVTISIENNDDSNEFAALPVDQNVTATARNWTGSVLWDGATMGDWTDERYYPSLDLASLVQTVVDRPGWCGGNSMAFKIESNVGELSRLVSSVDGSLTSAPVLRVKYDIAGLDPTDTGCQRKFLNIPVGASDHDGIEKPDGRVRLTRRRFNLGTVDAAGMIFSMPIKQMANVTSAKLRMTIETASTQTVDPQYEIKVEDIGDADPFLSTNSNMSGRTTLSGGVVTVTTVSPTAPLASEGDFLEIDVTTLVQGIVNRSDWYEDNHIAFFIEASGLTPPSVHHRLIYAYDSDPLQAPRLLVNVVEDRISLIGPTTRDKLLELVERHISDTSVFGITPSMGLFYEAALYWRGKPLEFGDARGTGRIPSEPGDPGYIIGDPKFYINQAGATKGFQSHAHKTLTSHPNSWTGGTYTDPVGLDCQFSHNPDCVGDFIDGTPTYISPIGGPESSICSKNFMVFLTDGAPNANATDTSDKIIAEFSEISSCRTGTGFNPQGSKGRCVIEMAEVLHNHDQSAIVPGTQTVETYTIAFNLSDTTARQWLQRIATSGGGEAYTADTAAELEEVLDDIFLAVIESSASYAAPAITTNFFNRTRSRDEIYFGLFTPALEKRWNGNVKRFRVCVDSTTQDATSRTTCTRDQVAESAVLDQLGTEAVDELTLLFKPTSQSYWSGSADGNETAAGGAGAEIIKYKKGGPTEPHARIIYTDSDSSGVPTSPTLLSNTGFQLVHDNWDSADMAHVHGVVCTNPSNLAVNSECEEKMLWLLGKDTEDEDEDGDIGDVRWNFADVIHASPVVMTYGFEDESRDIDGDGVLDPPNGRYDAGEPLIDKLLVNTNEGALRMLNPVDGSEDWRFIPLHLLANTRVLQRNNTGDHIYGMDATPVPHIRDNNGNSVIEPGSPENDSVHIYQVMRRGGDFVYALDLTPAVQLTGSADSVVPRLKWRIQGGTGDYVRMNDTWSRPIITVIRVEDGGSIVNKEVLIMGGGYDDDLDTHFGTNNHNPNSGNAIYIIDPEDGAKLLSISHDEDPSNGIASASGADIEIVGFNYSIVPRITALDSDDDGITDRLYFPDTGGNVWRVDLGNDIASSGGISASAAVTERTVVGHIAQLSASSDMAQQRRFYNEVAAVRVVDTVYTDTTTATDNTEGKMTYLVLTSGFRAKPLNTDVEDRMYALRDKYIGRMPDADLNYKADGPVFSTPITNADLASASSAALASEADAQAAADAAAATASGQAYAATIAAGGTVAAAQAAAAAAGASASAAADAAANRAKNKRGYYIDFPETGEKGLSSVVILFGEIFFTTYSPNTAVAAGCTADTGTAYGYSLKLVNADGVNDWDGDTDVDVNDRRRLLGSGLSSDPIPVFTDQGVKVIVGLQQSVQSLSNLNENSLLRTYWYEDTQL